MSGRFDPSKDIANQAKHGLSLAFGDMIFNDAAYLMLPTVRSEDGEDRFKVIGLADGKLFTGIFVWRGDMPRFISVRRSNEGEKRAYRHSG